MKNIIQYIVSIQRHSTIITPCNKWYESQINNKFAQYFVILIYCSQYILIDIMFSGKVNLWYTKMKRKQVQKNRLMQLVCWYWEKWKCMNWLKYFRNILYDYISQFAIPLSVHLAGVITFIITSPAGCKALCSASNGCHVHWIDTHNLLSWVSYGTAL